MRFFGRGIEVWAARQRRPTVIRFGRAKLPLCPFYLLDQLLRRLETDFVAKGGLRERMTRARLNHREGQPQRAR